MEPLCIKIDGSWKPLVYGQTIEHDTPDGPISASYETVMSWPEGGEDQQAFGLYRPDPVPAAPEGKVEVSRQLVGDERPVWHVVYGSTFGAITMPLTVKDHGFWELYVPPSDPEKEINHCRRKEADGSYTDWADYVRADGNFSADTVKIELIPSNPPLVRNASRLTEFMVPIGARVIEVTGLPDDLIVNVLLGKAYIEADHKFVDPPVNAPSCSAAQGRIMLRRAGLRAQVEQAIAASNDDELKDWWEYATVWEVASERMQALVAALNLPPSMVQDLVNQAAALKA